MILLIYLMEHKITLTRENLFHFYMGNLQSVGHQFIKDIHQDYIINTRKELQS